MPVHGKVLELAGVDDSEHQHGAGHHQPPEHLEQLPLQATVHLREGEAGQEEEHVDSLVDNEAASEVDHHQHAGIRVDAVLGVDTHNRLPQVPKQHLSLHGLCLPQ